MREIPSLFVPSEETSRSTAQPWRRSKTKQSLLLGLAMFPSMGFEMDCSVKVAAAQEEAAGLAHHFAAGVAHF